MSTWATCRCTHGSSPPCMHGSSPPCMHTNLGHVILWDVPHTTATVSLSLAKLTTTTLHLPLSTPTHMPWVQWYAELPNLGINNCDGHFSALTGGLTTFTSPSPGGPVTVVVDSEADYPSTTLIHAAAAVSFVLDLKSCMGAEWSVRTNVQIDLGAKSLRGDNAAVKFVFDIV
jgi:hypothetical protein